jgi:hypothetical protein
LQKDEGLCYLDINQDSLIGIVIKSGLIQKGCKKIQELLQEYRGALPGVIPFGLLQILLLQKK